MSDHKEDAPYFKVRAVLKSTWTLREAAHYLCGCDPKNSKFEISTDASNRVSKLFFWLKEKVKRNELFHVERGDLFKIKGKKRKPSRYTVDAFFECFNKSGKKIDKELNRLWKGSFPDTKTPGEANRVIYREAARLVHEKHKNLSRYEMACVLQELPEKVFKRHKLELKEIGPHKLDSILKNIGDRDGGKRSKIEKEEAKKEISMIDWSYVLEKL